jgi:hypothetical protein
MDEKQDERCVVNVRGVNFVGLKSAEEADRFAKQFGKDGFVSPIFVRADGKETAARKSELEVYLNWDRAHRERSQTK